MESNAVEKGRPSTSAVPLRGLAGITRGVSTTHVDRIVVIGQPAVGKTTFASEAPSPVFFCAEDGASFLDVHKFPPPTSWKDIFHAITALLNEEHEFKTFVVDTVDELEAMCWKHVCDPKGETPNRTIEDFGFGRGYTAALDEWRKLTEALDNLRKRRGITIILLAHASIKTFQNPDGPNYDRYTLKMNDKAASLLKGWADHVLFATFDTYVKMDDGNKGKGKGKGVGGATRILHTEHSAAWDAKTRCRTMPKVLPLEWAAFAAALAPANSEMVAQAVELRECIARVLVDLANPQVTAKVNNILSNVADVNIGKLNEILNTLTTKLNAKNGAAQ